MVPNVQNLIGRYFETLKFQEEKEEEVLRLGVLDTEVKFLGSTNPKTLMKLCMGIPGTHDI